MFGRSSRTARGVTRSGRSPRIWTRRACRPRRVGRGGTRRRFGTCCCARC